MLDWVFHDRTDPVRQGAFGCLFRYVTVGLEITEGMTLSGFLKDLARKSGDSLAHASYEWSIKRDNIFEHDMMIVCYETASIMSGSSISSIGGTRLNVESHAPINSRSLALQIIESPDQIVPYLMFNQAIYSEEKISRAVEVFSELLDRLLQADHPDRFSVRDLISFQ